jgi:type III pantothenate kinase
MILALDVENTNIVIGCFDGEEIYFTSRIAADRQKTGDEYAISFKSILEMHGVSLACVNGSIVASVTPALINVIKEALRLLLGTEPLVVGPGVKTGLNILMDNPSTLGSDLVVGAVAAMAEYPVPLIVVGLGTATTLLAVNEKKNFVGSVIAPGVALSAQALSEACDQLPRISIEAPRDVIGKNTIDCMRSGTVIGAAAMLDGLIERMEEQLGSHCTVIATGRLASVIVPQCRRDMTVDDTLLLKGLRRIYEKNIRK